MLTSVILILFLVLLTAALLRTVLTDGYGHRTPPRSHPPDPFDIRFIR